MSWLGVTKRVAALGRWRSTAVSDDRTCAHMRLQERGSSARCIQCGCMGRGHMRAPQSWGVPVRGLLSAGQQCHRSKSAP